MSEVATTATSALKPGRVPQAEPWAEHENLDPLVFTPANTKAKATVTAKPKPAKYQQYTTSTDTFSKVKGAEKK